MPLSLFAHSEKWCFPSYVEMFAQFAGLCLCVNSVCHVSHTTFPVAYNVFLSLVMYLHISLQYTSTNLFAFKLLGLSLSNGMDNPYMSTSLADFWGRRWNMVASSSLRHLIYDPIREGRVVPKEHTEFRHDPRDSSEQRRKAWGSFMAFLVSGLMHEYIMWIATGFWSGEMFLFFVVHGLATNAERAGKAFWTHHGLPPIPQLLSIALTIGFLFTTAELLFYPPIFSANWAERGVADLQRQLRSLSPAALHW
eukprot:GGOE01055389.1.p1 GENE.GGOE01055389.1~~GGOE01055389.1.p1  ORF type:complete len:252 (+),score=35.81 GGOE01055389.1:178-933(+)